MQRITKKKKKKIENLLPAPANYAFDSNWFRKIYVNFVFFYPVSLKGYFDLIPA